ncbi:hypothetical protein KUTeg_002423 [Tegillarca granosa]|uniref:Uncharacterized protein n=1 Tax=Tegillarca granosa TaxID=220873 RepID=A0ABQ9FVR0_TEGGR|nr:hypothetical protein KUTeg_002423 [Tegillarca granosa]
MTLFYSEISTCADMTDDDITDEIQTAEKFLCYDLEDDDDISDLPLPLPSSEEMFAVCDKLLCYFQHHENSEDILAGVC